MTTASVEFTIVPAYGQLENVKDGLEQLGFDIAQLCIEKSSHVAAIVGKHSPKTVERISSILHLIDIVCTQGVESVSLPSQIYSKEGAAIYSPPLQPHPGVMSGYTLSDAQYLGMIYRENGTTYLLQYIKPNGHTSEHYHRNTTEFFLSLLGKTILKVKDVVSKDERLEEIAKRVFTRVLPETVHQLRTREAEGINLLCMEPYDPDKKDHHYI
jgi:hypothetical protein